MQLSKASWSVSALDERLQSHHRQKKTRLVACPTHAHRLFPVELGSRKMATSRKLQDAHTRFWSLFASVIPRLSTYDPLKPPLSSSSSALLSDIATLQIRLHEFDGHFARLRQKLASHEATSSAQNDGGESSHARQWADALDREGVDVWNRTGLKRKAVGVKDDALQVALALSRRVDTHQAEGDNSDDDSRHKKRKLEEPGGALKVIAVGMPLPFVPVQPLANPPGSPPARFQDGLGRRSTGIGP